MQTSVLISLVLQNLFNEIISSLLPSQRGTREVSILPLSPLGNPPIPLKRLLKRRSAFLTPYDKLRIEEQILNDNCRVGACSNRLISRITDSRGHRSLQCILKIRIPDKSSTYFRKSNNKTHVYAVNVIPMYDLSKIKTS